MRKRGKVDANQKDIVKVFRRCGASVEILSNVGGGCPDIVVGFQGVNVLVEIKDGDKPESARQLTEDQKEFHAKWRGKLAVVKNEDEAIGLLNSIHEHNAMRDAAMCGDRWLETGNPWEETE